MLDMDIQELASLTTGEGDLENFERLFSKLKEMKGTMPVNEAYIVCNAQTLQQTCSLWDPFQRLKTHMGLSSGG